MFHFFSILLHRLTAWNTGGEGIHSPRLFYLVRHIFYDTARLYAWDDIEERRQAMLRAPKKIHIRDFGTGQDRDDLVMHIAQNSVMKPSKAQLLSRIVNYMSGKEYVPERTDGLTIVELGTSLGLTTAYLASVDSRNRVVSFEGSDEIAQMATLNWQHLQLHNISLQIGPIDDTLHNYAKRAHARIDFVLIDANHTGAATLRYFEWLLPLMDTNGIIAIDDIRYSQDMYRAWKRIVSHEGVTATMDLGQMGLVFFYPKVQQKLYKLRI
ncbi:MAG: class I SAM-dependent methyltransferase [Paludibacteraceae bacterium]|nr:class I SAM-dependent methyltransferase [Paludibacteraceae bacterium]